MKNNDDKLLELLAPHLEEHLVNLKAQKEALDQKIRELEKHLSNIGPGITTPSGKRHKRKRGENRLLLQTWFSEHPSRSVGQAEIASEIGISPSSARVVLDKLVNEGFLERDGLSWRVKQQVTTKQGEAEIL